MPQGLYIATINFHALFRLVYHDTMPLKCNGRSDRGCPYPPEGRRGTSTNLKYLHIAFITPWESAVRTPRPDRSCVKNSGAGIAA
nr:MAG TPA: hypothetical protein [Caudoviricetes sp.]